MHYCRYREKLFSHFAYIFNKRKHMADAKSVIQTYRILLSRRVLPCGKWDSIFSSIRKFKKSRTFPLDGREKKKEGGKGERAESRLRWRWIDVSKTQNSLDPGSSRVAVVVHAINQPIDSLRSTLLYPAFTGETFAPRRGHASGKMGASRCMGD